MDIGKVIRQIRKKRKMRQSDLAKKIGMRATSLSYIENGRSLPQPDNLKKIAQVLDIPLPVMYIMAVSPKDAPRSRRDEFRANWPGIQQNCLNIFFEDPDNLC